MGVQFVVLFQVFPISDFVFSTVCLLLFCGPYAVILFSSNITYIIGIISPVKETL